VRELEPGVGQVDAIEPGAGEIFVAELAQRPEG
jgi:hypothetical protein